MREVFPNVVTLDDDRLFTPNLVPGQRVYDEELHTIAGSEHRTWNPSKSKLGAFIAKGGRNFPFRRDSRVLYLGAANGTTPSHVSDIVTDGVLYAVEFSPRSFRDLLWMSEPRTNIVPLLADAWRPEIYSRFIGKVDIVFQDIAQRQQAAIFAKNLARFKPQWGILAIKARSVDVAMDPRDVYRMVSEELEATSGYTVVETVELGPFEKDHACIVLRPRGEGAPRPQPREERRDDRGSQDRRDERPRGGYERRDERPRGGGGFGGGGGGFQRRDDRPRGGGGGGGFQRRDDRRGPPPGREDRRYDRRG